MTSELRDLRTSLDIPAKEIVAEVQTIYPKYDKTLQSKCERGQEYGITIQANAMEALYKKFAPEKTAAKQRRRKDRHRLQYRIHCRLEESDYMALQAYARADGYSTMQDWLSHMVHEFIAKKGKVT